MQNTHVISLTTANTLRVLQRVATVFSRQRVNIEELNVRATTNPNVAHLSITVIGDTDLLDKLTKQLKKIIELIDVEINTSSILYTNLEENIYE